MYLTPAISYSDRVTIDEIETFVSIARLGGFARAAEGLHRSQPAISRRVEMREELRLGTLRIIDVPALRGGLPVTLVRRQNGSLSGAAQNLVAVIKAGATKRAGRPRALSP
jgi:hypothetical protein